MISTIYDLIVTVVMGAGALGGLLWYAFSRGQSKESDRRDAVAREAEIETMERINADNPHAGLPVDERLHRHTGKR